MKLFEFLGLKTPKEKPTEPKESVVERLFTKEQIEAWDKIKPDKQLRGILAHFILGNLEKKEELVLANVKDFLHKYPNLRIFQTNAMPDDFLIGLEIRNGLEKKKQYEQKLQEFERIMYGESEQ